MSDMADVFNGWRKHKQAKRRSNTEQSTQALIDAGVPFTSNNGGAHLVVTARDGITIDFWPSTGLWMLRQTKTKHRGVFRLIQRVIAEGSKQ